MQPPTPTDRTPPDQPNGEPAPAGAARTTKLTRPSDVRALLAQAGISPRKALGQNFLIDANIVDIILAAADIGHGDCVLEIGPGLGVLTERLLATAQRVIAVEKDAALCAQLRARLAGRANIELICADVLRADLPGILAAGVTRVVANLPFSVGSRILVELTRAAARPPRIVVTVQREVAERMAAAPGSKDYGLLSVWVQIAYAVALRKHVSPACFHPRPAVWSTVVILAEPPGGVRPCVPAGFHALTKAAFSQRRKQLANALGAAPPSVRVSGQAVHDALARLGLDPRARPGDLSPAQWLALTELVM
ncbi:MAG: ribosomal RNA small subunit methyltransferase A [Kiritimatiellae bacterium]|nr:ribosomal RNA small subunit methyltransferase A [Kiritimatiellia bacterium]